VHAIALIVLYCSQRRIDRDLVEVGAAQSRDLRIDIRMDSTTEQRVIGEVDAGNDVRRTEGEGPRKPSFKEC